MKNLWNTFIYEPIYNGLIFIAQHLSFADVGIAVIILTIVVRLVIFPLSKKSIISQYKMRALEPKLREIKARGLTREAEAQETFALYKAEKINPFSGCLYLIIQLPVLLALYFALMNGVTQPDHLYNFLSTDGLSSMFLGIIDITKPFLPLAILAGITQAIQAFLAPQPTVTDDQSFQGQFTKSLAVQTRYVLPLVIIFIANTLASAVSLYWTVANLFSIGQELYVRRQIKQGAL